MRDFLEWALESPDSPGWVAASIFAMAIILFVGWIVAVFVVLEAGYALAGIAIILTPPCAACYLAYLEFERATKD